MLRVLDNVVDIAKSNAAIGWAVWRDNNCCCPEKLLLENPAFCKIHVSD